MPEESPLAKRRKEVGLTQKQLGEIINKSDQTVSAWENGIYWARLSPIEFIALCKALGWEHIDDIPPHWGPKED